jgi:hypothetical protein
VFVAAACVLKDLGLENEGRQTEMLNCAHDKSSRDPGKERGENDSPDHETLPLVAGKADGVTRIVGRVVSGGDMRQADTEYQKDADDQRGDAGSAAPVG